MPLVPSEFCILIASECPLLIETLDLGGSGVGAVGGGGRLGRGRGRSYLPKALRFLSCHFPWNSITSPSETLRLG